MAVRNPNILLPESLSQPVVMDFSGYSHTSLLTEISEQLTSISTLRLQHGAVLLRGLSIESAADFDKFINCFVAQRANYTNPSTPRHLVGEQIYTSTEYPAQRTIVQHNECSYSTEFPSLLFLACLQPPESGGQTPLTDSRAVYNAMPKALREKVEQYGVVYERNFVPGIDLSWQTVYGVTSREQLAQYADAQQMDYYWHQTGDPIELTTMTTAQGVVSHPKTAEKVWFNQAHLFHHSQIVSTEQEAIQQYFGQSIRPRDAYLGDGTEFSTEDIQIINDIYTDLSYAAAWQQGDFLIVDNLLFAHGRKPFTGARKVIVTMA